MPPAAAQIRVLPDHVANKIAAGEVVDRPASVAKELVENALDAGSSQIDLQVVAGGRKLLSVSDNGRGMERDEALLALERHATSKIHDVEDIEHIATLGFRGEALPAIASVSRLRLVTAAAGRTAGTELLVTGGKLQDVREAGCPAGTLIEVRDLFFNVPARRKFLRSHQTELGHVRTCFLRIALARCEVGLSLTVDGREAYRLPAGDTLEQRIAALFGSAYLQGFRPVLYRAGTLSVTGFAGLPATHRSDRAEQYFFVNGRSTAAPVLSYALREGYRSLLARDRHPCVFLFIELDPGAVDVNVHPTKREVRFRRSGDVRDAVIAAIRRALGVSAAETAPAEPRTAGLPSAPPAVTDALPIRDLPAAHAFRYPRTPALEPLLQGVDVRSAAAGPPGAPAAEEKSSAAPSAEAPWVWCRVVGQVGGLYVVLETDEGMVLMDPHAAHERVLFDRLMRQVRERDVPSQALLLPQTVELAPADAARLRGELDELKALGFGLSEFGGGALVVDALPACMSDSPAAPLLRDMAAALAGAGKRHRRDHWRQEAMAQAACKAAVKARKRLSLEEIERLVIDLARTEMPYTCPHGRPTLILHSFAELNRKFGRG